MIDLTLPLGPVTPVYPGDPSVEVTPASSFDRDGCADVTIRLGNHNGTHIDAPAHMLPGGRTLDTFGLESFMGPGKVVDLGEGTPALDVVEPGDMVLLRTGHSDRVFEPGYFERDPGVSVELAEALVARGAKLVGIDAGSVDSGPPFPVHKVLLSSDVLIMENVVGLDRLTGVTFELIALPLFMALDGAPCRAVAKV